MSTPASAGWYQDRVNPALLRWWDGAAWAEQTNANENTQELYGAPPDAGATPVDAGRAVADNFLGKAQGIFQSVAGQAVAHKSGLSKVAGAALIADGLVGIDNPLSGRKRAGLFGSMAGMFIGVLFVVIGLLWLRPTVGDNWVTTTAAATDVQVSLDSKGSQTYSATYTYSDKAGVKHTIASTMSTGSRMSVGDTVDVAYDPNKPADASITSGLQGKAWMIFAGLGAILAVVSTLTLIMRVLTLWAGIALFLKGRKVAKAKVG